MVGQFFRAKPLQASKLAVAVVIILSVIGQIVGAFSGPTTDGVVWVSLVGLCLMVVIGIETVLTGCRFIHSGGPLNKALSNRPYYTVFRAIEAGAVALVAGAFVVLVSQIPSDPPAGPGALVVVAVVVGLALLVIGGTLLRTLFEYYEYRCSHRSSSDSL